MSDTPAKRYEESEYPIEVRFRTFTSKEDEEVIMAQMDIFPLPKSIQMALYDHLRDAVNNYLTEVGLTSGFIAEILDPRGTDPHGGPQKVQP